MGLAVVLMFYAVALTIVATIGAVVLGGATFLLTRHSIRAKRATIAAAVFPYACVGFAGAWFVAYAVTNYEVFHRDPGLGDTWETPLPNGYALMMIDTTDQGTVYNPKTQGGGDSVVGQSDTEFGVRQLQVSKSLILGARDSGYFGRIGQESRVVDTYFVLDAANGRIAECKSLDELRKQAASDGVALKLRPFESVFGDYRTTWFDYVAGAVLVLVPTAGFFLLARWIWGIRRSQLAAGV